MTIYKISAYQIEQLKGYFALCTIESLGLFAETGDLIIEYIPRYAETPGIETKKIPHDNPEHHKQ